MRRNNAENQGENCPRTIKKQGDWVCVMCHNLNYSFRDSCNRCKNITRDQNTKVQKIDRNPLGELTEYTELSELNLNKHSSYEEKNRGFLEEDVHSHSENTKKHSSIEPHAFLQPFVIPEPESCLKWTSKGFASQGFASLLFLTPVRTIKLQE